jgi:2-polyprenyl-3-methyl-5-hydroxy-6-metoxy-1,4-benzoquinol methylase
MLDEIGRLAARLTYDFRATANPDDPLVDRWPEWVAYYRMKAAIAAAVRPESICEIGVRYGYSAAAFLHGAGEACYTGIDLDTATFGGVPGALAWARRILPADRCTFHVGDSQQMTRLPGGPYDLVHIDGQQNGDGTWHDLELAAGQARWVLLDGYFWTRPNMLAATEWLLRNQARVEWYGVLTGYGGELLVKLRPNVVALTEGAGTRSADLITSYDAGYYCGDCGGHEGFRRHGGKRLDDVRLRAVAALGALAAGGRVLDLGCGRGELAYHFARQGFAVTAVDYSTDAIALARSCFAGEEALLSRVTFVTGDINVVPLEGPYDLVVAADLVEHLAPEEVERLYARVARELAPGGRLIVHTYPNRWLYRWNWPRLRRQAAAAGGWLPPDPRTPYERLMHINEQSPRVLRDQLRRAFPAVALWLADPEEPEGTLRGRLRPSAARTLRDIFAVASATPIDTVAIRGLLAMEAIAPATAAGVVLRALHVPTCVPAGREFTVEVAVENRTAPTLTSFPPDPVRLAYHWRDRSSTALVWDGVRSPLVPPLPGGRSARYRMTVVAPAGPGGWHLELSLVQERRLWFHQVAGFTAPVLDVEVVEA